MFEKLYLKIRNTYRKISVKIINKWHYHHKKLPKNVIYAFITGENAREIMDGAIAAGFYNVTYRQSLKECFMESTVVRADNVLFSPASSSFDRYKNFVERGKAFDDLFFEL